MLIRFKDVLIFTVLVVLFACVLLTLLGPCLVLTAATLLVGLLLYLLAAVFGCWVRVEHEARLILGV
jgi:hypothetical protein